MKQTTLVSIALLFFASPAHAGWIEDRINETTNETREIEQVVLTLNSKSIQCSDPSISRAMNIIEAQTDRLTQATRAAYDPALGAGSHYMGKTVMNNIRSIVVENRFSLADALLNASCLDDANAIYRSTISTFTGSMYDAIRQRALMGVEDVRDKRRSQ